MSAASSQVKAPSQPTSKQALEAAAFKSERSHHQYQCPYQQQQNGHHLSKKTRIELLGAANDHNYNLPRRAEHQKQDEVDERQPKFKRMAATATIAAPVARAEQLMALEASNASNNNNANGGHMDDCMAAMVLMFLSCRPGGEECLEGPTAATDVVDAAGVKAAATVVSSATTLDAQVARSGSEAPPAAACSGRETSAKVGTKRNSEPIEMDTSSQRKLYQRHFKRRLFSNDSGELDGTVAIAGRKCFATRTRRATHTNGVRQLRELDDEDFDEDDDDRTKLAFVESPPPKVEDEMIFELQQVDQVELIDQASSVAVHSIAKTAGSGTSAMNCGASLSGAAQLTVGNDIGSQLRGNKKVAQATAQAMLTSSQETSEAAEESQKEKGTEGAATITTATSGGGKNEEAKSNGENSFHSQAAKAAIAGEATTTTITTTKTTTTATKKTSQVLDADKLNGPANVVGEAHELESKSNCNPATTDLETETGEKPAAPTLVSQQQQVQPSATATVNLCNGKQPQPQQQQPQQQLQQQLRQQLRFRMNNPVKTRTIFSCMWPGCTKNYDALEDIERHVRAHLGPKQCDAIGDEDFYYEETEVDEATYLAIFSRRNTLPLSPSHNSDGLSSGQSFASSSPATSPICSSGDSSSSSSSASSAASSANCSSSSYPSSQLYANSIDWNHFLADHNQLMRASSGLSAGTGTTTSLSSSGAGTGKWLPAGTALAGGSSNSNATASAVAATASGKQAQLAALTGGNQQQQLQVYHNQHLHLHLHQQQQQQQQQVASAQVASAHRFGRGHSPSVPADSQAAIASAINGGSGGGARSLHAHHTKHNNHSAAALGTTSGSQYLNHQLSQHHQRHLTGRLALSSPSPPNSSSSPTTINNMTSSGIVAAAAAAAAAAAGGLGSLANAVLSPGLDSLAASSASQALQFSMQLTNGSPVPSPVRGAARPSSALYQRRSPNQNHLSNSNHNHRNQAASSTSSELASHSQQQPVDHTTIYGNNNNSATSNGRMGGAKRGRKPKQQEQRQATAAEQAGYHLGLLMQHGRQRQQAATVAATSSTTAALPTTATATTTTSTTSGQTTHSQPNADNHLNQQHHLKHNLSQRFFQNQVTSSQSRQSNQSSNSSNSNSNHNHGGLVAATVANLRGAAAAAAAMASANGQVAQQQQQMQLGAVRRTRGENRKCRKVYGMERRDLWCTQCKWKKACSRFCDP